MYVSVCVVSVIVKRPELLPCVVDGRSRNPLYYYYKDQVKITMSTDTYTCMFGFATAYKYV